MFTLFVAFVCALNETVPNGSLPEDTQEADEGWFHMFEQACENETIYSSDEILSVLCPMYNNFRNHSDDSDDSKVGSIISLVFEVLSFLIGLIGVGYFIYLRCILRKDNTLNASKEDVELEIQKI